MPDTDNKVLIGELGLDISDVVDAQSTLKTTFSKDFQYINVETVRFVAEIQKKFGKLDEATLKHAQALLEAGKLAKAQESQYVALGKAIGTLVASMDSAEKQSDVIGQIFRMFIPYNETLANLFKKTADEAVATARAIGVDAKAQRQLASDTANTNQKLKEQNQLLNGQKTSPKPASKPDSKKDKGQKPTPASSPAPRVEDAVQSVEHLSDVTKEATQDVQTLTHELNKPVTSSPAAMATPVEEVKEQAHEAKQEVISLGDVIKRIGKKTYKADDLADLDKSLEQTYAGIYGSKGVENVTKLNYEEIGRSLDAVKKRYEDFFSDISQMFKNKNLGELGSSISKLMKQTDLSAESKDWRKQLFDGINKETFDLRLSDIIGGTSSKEAEKLFRDQLKRIIENANQMRIEVENNLSEAYSSVAKYEAKSKKASPEKTSDTSVDKNKQNIAVQHLETILELRKEIAAAGNASKAPEEKELQLYEYLANSLVLAKRKGNTSFIDEAREKYKSLFAEFENAKGIPSLLKLIMEGADGAENYLSGRSVARSANRKSANKPTSKETHAQTPEAAATENAQALIKKMEQLRDLLREMENLDVGTTEFLRAEREASQQNAEIKGFYSTIQNQIPDCEAKTQALARVEFSRRDVLKDISEQQKAYAGSMFDIQNQGADSSLVQEYESTYGNWVEENKKLLEISGKLRQERKTLHGAEQTQNTELIAQTKENITNLEKELQVVEQQRKAYKDKLDLIRYGNAETKKADETPAPKTDSPKRESKVEVLETDFEKYGVSSKSKRLVEVYKTEEQALERVVALLKERHQYQEGSDQYNDLTKQIEDASKELEKAHWSLLGTRKAGTPAERSTLKNAIAQQAMEAVEELNSAGIKIEAIITRITQTTKSGFSKAINGAVGSTKRDQAALQDVLFAGAVRQRGSKSSGGTGEKETKKDLTEIDQILGRINKAMDDYVRRSGDQAKYHTGSKKYVKAEEDRASALKIVEEQYQHLLKDIPESEAKTKALAAIEERRAKIAEEIEKNAKSETHKDKKTDDAEKAVNAAKKQKESLKELTSAFEGKTKAQKKSEESSKAGEAASEKRTRSRKKETEETKQSVQASKESADAKKEEASAQEKLNNAVEKGTQVQTKNKSGKSSGTRKTSRRKGSGDASPPSSKTPTITEDLSQEQQYINLLRERAQLLKDFYSYQEKYLKADDKSEVETYKDLALLKSVALEDNEKELQAIEKENSALVEQKSVRDAILHVTDVQAIGEQKVANAQKESGIKEQQAAVDQLSKAYAQFYKIQEEMARTNPETGHYRNLEEDLKKAQENILNAVSAIDALDVSAGTKEALVAKAEASAEVEKAAKKLRDTTTKEADKQAQKEADAIKKAADAKQKAAEDAKKAREDERQAAEKAADDEVRAYEEAEARKAAALEKTKKAQQEYNLAELNKSNEERAAYENWWEQALLDQEKEMFDAPEAAISRIKKAYEELFNVQKRLEAAKEGTAEYDSLAAAEQKAREAVSAALASVDALNASEEAKKALIDEALEAARTTKAYQDLHAARTKREDNEAKKQKSDKDIALDAIKQEISLTSQLNDLKKRQAQEKSASGRAEYDDNIRAIEQMIAGYRDVYTEILRNNAELLDNEDILRQLVILEDKVRKGEKDVNKERQKSNALLGALGKVKEGFLLSVGNAAYRMVENFVEDKIREFWTNGWEYAQSYYDQLNEIRIVTGQTAEEAEAMGKTYRNMAKEMSVSSTEIASAAVEFWRQGLDESEVNDRLKNTTQYAKISGLEFQEAAELVTAATNSMNLDSQRVVDVFAYLGDASASGNPLISHLAQRCA